VSVKLTRVQVTKLLLQHKISEIDIICSAKPGLTEELYIVYKEEFSITATCATCILDKGKASSHPLVREDVI
jgi:hypothetical protein